MSAGRDPLDGVAELLDRLRRELAAVDGGAGRVDVADGTDEIVVSVDLPGYEPADLDVSVSGTRLHVEAEREDGADESVRKYHRRERRRERVDRVVELPAPVDGGEASATLEQGVLTVRLPKVEAGDGHTIEVN